MSKVKNIFLYFTCFLTGAIILILEILGFRIFAPYFGNSVYVSGSLIGIILSALSLGYFFGGKIADKYPKEKYIYIFILSSSIYLIIIYIWGIPILKLFQGWGIIYGSLISTVVFFGFPMTLLSMVSPYLIKLLATMNQLGTVAGKIYAISTAGSIIGSFLSTFLLVPVLGSSTTLAICIIILILLSAIGLSFQNIKFASVGLIIFSLFIPPVTQEESGLIYQTESFYNTIKIYENKHFRWMVLNDPFWWQSYMPLRNIDINTYREYFSLAPFFTDVRNVLVLGMSAGASVNHIRHYFNTHIDAVEIDPVVVELAQKYFNVYEDKKLNIYVDDARSYLASTLKKYDFIEIDLFHGGPEIPFYVATKEFFIDVRKHINENGLMMMSVLGIPGLQGMEGLFKSIANTISTIFPSVYFYPIRTSTIIIATKQPTTEGDLKKKLRIVDGPLFYYAKKVHDGLKPYKYDYKFPIFSDNLAPVELYSFKITEKIKKLLRNKEALIDNFAGANNNHWGKELK